MARKIKEIRQKNIFYSVLLNTITTKIVRTYCTRVMGNRTHLVEWDTRR